jgi:hypothetical protein
MSTPVCALCGLRFRAGTELAHHVRDDHPHEPVTETRDTLKVARHKHAEDLERPVDQVLGRH